MQLDLSDVALLYIMAVLQVILRENMSAANQCEGNSRITGQGTGLKVNATCHLNGTIEFSSHISVPSDGFQIDYNCTGNDPTEGTAFGFAYNGPREVGSFIVEEWNYYNSTCIFSGCYGESDPPFNTYSIPSISCTVVTPAPVATPVMSLMTTTPQSTSYSSQMTLLGTPLPTAKVKRTYQRIEFVAALAATAACIVFICLPVILIMISIPLSKKRKRLYNLGYITDHEALKQDFDAKPKHLDVSPQLVKCTDYGSTETITEKLHNDLGIKEIFDKTEDEISEYESYYPLSTLTQGSMDFGTNPSADLISSEHSMLSMSELSISSSEESNKSISIVTSRSVGEKERVNALALYTDTVVSHQPEEECEVDVIHHTSFVVEDTFIEHHRDYNERYRLDVSSSTDFSSDSGYLKCDVMTLNIIPQENII